MKNKILIILPGWGGNTQTWTKFTDIAERKIDTYVIDLPCFGIEPCPNEVWGVKEYANFVKDKIKGITSDPVVLLGHSFGGQVATYMAAHNPELIDKLILSGAAVFRPSKLIKRTVFGKVAKLGKLIFKLPLLKKYSVQSRRIIYKIANSPDYSHTDGIKKEIFKKIIRQDLVKLLPQINVPTLVVWGTKDSYVPVKKGKKIAKLIPNAKLKIFSKGKHGLHLQIPKELFQVIYDFIN